MFRGINLYFSGKTLGHLSTKNGYGKTSILLGFHSLIDGGIRKRGKRLPFLLR
ncbi:MAG: hypothetical protein HOD92_26425 [Deltaproteobacteria bacterium]|nr:hypothetical protein [Deltaproteobacteria bacterium]MBT4527846.1 hypothetical protein [Deltaproteobacteria bacterium]